MKRLLMRTWLRLQVLFGGKSDHICVKHLIRNDWVKKTLWGDSKWGLSGLPKGTVVKGADSEGSEGAALEAFRVSHGEVRQ